MIVSAGQKFLGRFKVLRCLNQNTRSSVFLVRDEFKQNRLAVAKFVRDRAGDNKFHLREVSAYQQAWLMDSSNPRHIDQGRIDRDWLYLIREHVMGTPLADKSTIHFSELIALLHSCLRTLESYARAHLLHGDVKPDNIVFDPVQPNAGGRLIDPLGFQVSESGYVTPQHGAGTENYIPPEEEATFIPGPTRDIFGLGLTFLSILQSRPAKYQHYPLARKLEALCRTACNSLAARYSTITEMRQALDDLIEGYDFRSFADILLDVLV